MEQVEKEPSTLVDTDDTALVEAELAKFAKLHSPQRDTLIDNDQKKGVLQTCINMPVDDSNRYYRQGIHISNLPDETYAHLVAAALNEIEGQDLGDLETEAISVIMNHIVTLGAVNGDARDSVLNVLNRSFMTTNFQKYKDKPGDASKRRGL